MKPLNSSLYRLVQFGLLYLGVIKGITGFMNLITFLLWSIFVMTVIATFNKEIWANLYEIDKKKKNSWFSYLLSIVYGLILIFYGHFILATIYTLIWFLIFIMVKLGGERANLSETNPNKENQQ